MNGLHNLSLFSIFFYRLFSIKFNRQWKALVSTSARIICTHPPDSSNSETKLPVQNVGRNGYNRLYANQKARFLVMMHEERMKCVHNKD